MQTKKKAFIFDLETLGLSPHGVISSAAFLVFDFNEPLNFNKLKDRALYVKFDASEQRKKYDRKLEKETLDWWKRQSKDAQNEIKPSKKDVSLETGLDIILKYLASHGINKPGDAIGFCRGQSFDFPLIVDAFEQTGKIWPCNFWEQKDTRTYIGTMIGDIDSSTVPVPDRELPGFVAHNAVHDIIKDLFQMRYAELYAFEEVKPGEVYCWETGGSFDDDIPF